MRLFGFPTGFKSRMGKLGMQEGEAIENRILTSAIENAQKKVEAMNFDIRKQLLEYDNVMNRHRTVYLRPPPLDPGHGLGTDAGG